MTTRRTARQVTPVTPETDIVDIAPETPVVDTAVVEAPETDIPVLSVEAILAAHEAEKAAFVELPRKGDIVAHLSAEPTKKGQIVQTGTIAQNPDKAAHMVQILWARDGRQTAVFVAHLTKINPNVWTYYI